MSNKRVKKSSMKQDSTKQHIIDQLERDQDQQNMSSYLRTKTPTEQQLSRKQHSINRAGSQHNSIFNIANNQHPANQSLFQLQNRPSQTSGDINRSLMSTYSNNNIDMIGMMQGGQSSIFQANKPPGNNLLQQNSIIPNYSNNENNLKYITHVPVINVPDLRTPYIPDVNNNVTGSFNNSGYNRNNNLGGVGASVINPNLNTIKHDWNVSQVHGKQQQQQKQQKSPPIPLKRTRSSLRREGMQDLQIHQVTTANLKELTKKKQDKQEKNKPEVTIEVSSVAESSQADGKKKRGRKKTDYAKYKQESELHIAELRADLDNTKDQKTKQKLRNQISAQQSRLKNRENMVNLNIMNQGMSEKVQELIYMLENCLDQQSKIKLGQELFDKIPDKAEFQPVQKGKVSKSTSIFGGKKRSRNGATDLLSGQVPGFDGSYDLSAQEILKFFKRLCEKFCGVNED